MLVTVPVLSLFLLVLVVHLPGITTTAWDSLLLQARGFSLALESNDLLGMMASSAQALILVLQMLGISYVLSALGRRLLGVYP